MMKYIHLALFSLFLSCSKPAEEKDVIRMAFNPAEASDRVNTNGKAVGDILEKTTGYKFKTYVTSDYTALITALNNGQADIAWLAPFAFVLAESKGGAKVMLKSVRHGAPNQYSAIIVRADSPYKTLADLKGKTIAWTDPASSSGHIAPKAALVHDAGIDIQNHFGKQTFAGSHEALVIAVATGSVDAGATFADTAEGKTGSWTRYEKKLGPDQRVRAIYVTPPMPSDTVSASKEFAEKQPEKFQKVNAALKALSETEEGRQALRQLYSIDALIDAKTEDYEPLRKAAALIGSDVLDKK